MAVRVEEVAVDSPRHTQQLALRGDVLRIPLGLDPATARNAREAEARHFVAIDDADDAVIGCVSLLPLHGDVGKLFQMAVSPAHQRQGIGRVLVRHLEAAALDSGIRQITMHARDIAVPFYASLGYHTEGDVFFEVTIPHYVMTRDLS